MQIMTDHKGDRGYCLTQGNQRGLEKWSVSQGKAEGERSFVQTPQTAQTSVLQ